MLLLVVFAVFTCVSGQVATPRRPLGFVYNQGRPDAKVHVEIYIDLICPDSREAWPHVTAMADHYGPGNVRLTVYMFPLPYHQNGFYAARAAFAVHDLTNGSQTFAWINKIMMDNLADLRDSVFHNQSDADLLNVFTGYASELGIDAEQLITAVDRRQYNIYEYYARVTWKYACTRGVAGTPTYVVNGIVQPQVLQSWNLSQWTSFLDPLLTEDVFDDVNGISQVPNPDPVTCDKNGAGATTLMSATPLLLVLITSLL